MFTYENQDKLPELSSSVVNRTVERNSFDAKNEAHYRSYLLSGRRDFISTHPILGVVGKIVDIHDAIIKHYTYHGDTTLAPMHAKLSKFSNISTIQETNAQYLQGMTDIPRPVAAGMMRNADLSPVGVPNMDISNLVLYTKMLANGFEFNNKKINALGPHDTHYHAFTGEAFSYDQVSTDSTKIEQVTPTRYEMLEKTWEYMATRCVTGMSTARFSITGIGWYGSDRVYNVETDIGDRYETGVASQLFPSYSASVALGLSLTDTWIERKTFSEFNAESALEADANSVDDSSLTESELKTSNGFPVCGVDYHVNKEFATIGADATLDSFVHIDPEMYSDASVVASTANLASKHVEVTALAMKTINSFFSGARDPLDSAMVATKSAAADTSEDAPSSTEPVTFGESVTVDNVDKTVGEYKYGSELDENNHTFYTRPNGERYYPRTMSIKANGTSGTDVEFVRKAKSSDIPVLLFGPPGTGKSALVDTALANLVSINGTGDTETADFIGSYEQTGSDTFEWRDGPLLTAMDNGWPLFVDEIALIDSRALSVLYSVMDGRQEINVTASPSRGIVRAQEGFYVIAACNPDVPGAVMSEALLSRFTLQIEVNTDYDNLESLGISNLTAKMARNLHKKFTENKIVTEPQIRELLAFDKNMKVFGTEVAVGNLLSSADDNDRSEYRNVATSVFGVAATTLSL